MNAEDKDLLLQDLCARLSYGVKCCCDILSGEIKIDTLTCINKVIIGQGIYWDCYFENCDLDIPLETVRPYLRPLSSMTDEEEDEYEIIIRSSLTTHIDWLNKNMFDYRGLIPKGLANVAPEGMYEKEIEL